MWKVAKESLEIEASEQRQLDQFRTYLSFSSGDLGSGSRTASDGSRVVATLSIGDPDVAAHRRLELAGEIFELGPTLILGFHVRLITRVLELEAVGAAVLQVLLVVGQFDLHAEKREEKWAWLDRVVALLSLRLVRLARARTAPISPKRHAKEDKQQLDVHVNGSKATGRVTWASSRHDPKRPCQPCRPQPPFWEQSDARFPDSHEASLCY